MKLNKGSCSFRTVIINFSDKTYQEVNFESQFKIVPRCK